MENSKLKAKVVVITGASAGVGRATAVKFAKEGSRIALLARNRESLEGAKKEVENNGGEAMVYVVDVSDPEKMRLTADTIESEMGPIDIWVNNAMVSVFSPIKEMTPAEFKRVTEVTYLGQVYGAMEALRCMSARNQGKIVFVGSALAYRGIPLQAPYCGAKHGIQGFYDSLRTELLHDKSGIKVSMVELPALNTTQFGWVKSRLSNKARPMGAIYQPEIAAEAIKYAATHDRREIFVAFPTFQAILGNKFFPALLDKIMANNGFKGQQTDEPEDKNRPNNLWEPVPGNHSAHGSFDNEAKSRSPMLWVSTHWRIVWFFILILIILIIWWII